MNLNRILTIISVCFAVTSFAPKAFSQSYPYWTAYASARHITPVANNSQACQPQPKGHYLCWTSDETAKYGNCVGRGMEPIGQKSVEMHFKQLSLNQITEDTFINQIAHNCDQYKGINSEKYISCNRDSIAHGNMLCMDYCLDAQNPTTERCAAYVQYNANVPTLQFSGNSFPGFNFKPTDIMTIKAQVNSGDGLSFCAATTAQKASCENSANYVAGTTAAFGCSLVNGATVCTRSKSWKSMGLPTGEHYYICTMNARTQDKNCRTIIIEKK